MEVEKLRVGLLMSDLGYEAQFWKMQSNASWEIKSEGKLLNDLLLWNDLIIDLETRLERDLGLIVANDLKCSAQ